MTKKLPKFPDFVEISSFDALRDPTYPTKKMLDFLFFGKSARYVCAECHDYKTFRLIKNNVRGDCFTIKCKCGCHIIYPNAPERNDCRLWKFIPKDKYKKDDSGGQGSLQ